MVPRVVKTCPLEVGRDFVRWKEALDNTGTLPADKVLAVVPPTIREPTPSWRLPEMQQ